MQIKTSEKLELRLYCVMRTDIEMPVGKMMTQAGHAFVSVLRENPLVDQYFEDNQTKIVLKAKNFLVLQRAIRECNDLNINNYLVTDAGRTIFPEPTITCLGIGPVYYNDLPKYIQRLQLF